MPKIWLGAIALCAGLYACAPVDEGDRSNRASGNDLLSTAALVEEGQRCFFPRQATGFHRAPRAPNGAERIYVDVSASDTYLFETFSACPQLDFARGVAFDQAGTGRICDGLDVDLIVPDRDLGPQRCPVRMVGKLTESAENAR